jgi:hypothetical protein
LQLNSYTAGVIKNCVCTKHDFGVSCYTWAQAVGFYGGETGEEVEKDWDNLRDYYGTSIKYLKKLLRANRLPLGCAPAHRTRAAGLFIRPRCPGDTETQLSFIFLVFHCQD